MNDLSYNFQSYQSEQIKIKRYVSFKLNDQNFAFEIENIVEVIPIYPITKVFHTPDFIKGVINLRGEIIAIVDLLLFFTLQTASSETTEFSKIIITRSDDRICGFTVDSVSQIDTLDDARKESIPSTRWKTRSYIKSRQYFKC